MTAPQHPQEEQSNPLRAEAARVEPRSLRTYTPTQAVLAKSFGVFHLTPEGRRLYDFSSGVLVANLAHTPGPWHTRFAGHMGCPSQTDADFFPALPMTAYNAVTAVEVEATRRLIDLLQSCEGGRRLEQVM